MGLRVNKAVWLEKYNRWQIKVRKDGVRRTFTCAIPGRRGQRECHRKADEWLDQNIANTSVRIFELFAKWIGELKVTTGRSHWSQYEMYGRVYILPLLGTHKISSIKEQDLQDVLTNAHKRGNKGKGLAAKTLKNIRGCIKSFIKYARKSKVTTLHPENLSIPASARKSKRDALKLDDIKILFSTDRTVYKKRVVSDWYINAYRFAVVTGMRPGDLIGLTNTDLDLENGICTVNGAINVYNERTDGKNDNAHRSFLLPDIALKILRDQREMLTAAHVISRYVFPRADGTAIRQKTYYRRWCAYRDRNGISKRSPYEMRHTFFSATKKLPAELVKLVGGHSVKFDTFGHYGHVMDGDATTAARLINAAFMNILSE